MVVGRDWTLARIQEALSNGELTCENLVEDYLLKIEESKDLNAYIEVFAAESRRRARILDEIFQSGERPMGRLWGAVISLKDVIAYAGHKLTAGSKILEGYESLFSATAVERLIAEDAIIIGRVNCDEFAMGSDNETSVYGPVRNAQAPDHVPGGSSGGSAVAVQANTCLLSVGSDTGGSVRQPASFCDLIGFKPSYGRISRHGLIAYASSFDQIGLIGRELEDLKLSYEVMQGQDEYDGTCATSEMLPNRKMNSNGSMRLAYIEDAMTHAGLQPEIQHAFHKNLEDLEAEGHQVEKISFDLMEYIIPCYYVLTAAEASSNLSRYDGIRYGYRVEGSSQLDDMYTKTRTRGFGTEVKRRILLGTFVLSVGYYDAYFAKAQKIRRLIKEQFDGWTSQYDAVLLPMTPTTAWKLGSGKSPVEIYLADIYSVLANLVGAPAMSIPLGKDRDQLPFGLQILTAEFDEERLFFVASHMRKIQQNRL
ncbi:MAG: Asp-tRNA(Asn)/Glu-tRNA(Gln) amidotransferase subunit GatA [Saprospiraceae bacterium]|nr:Asp-tRNA(Asn)/Glu-tRNA(Gln) amidotransferase subunit GatA [Saprospiraceae bacterium]